jgi:putative transposase
MDREVIKIRKWRTRKILLLGFKTELKLNQNQGVNIVKHCEVARHAWNWGLGLSKQILDHNQKNLTVKSHFPQQ